MADSNATSRVASTRNINAGQNATVELPDSDSDGSQMFKRQ